MKVGSTWYCITKACIQPAGTLGVGSQPPSQPDHQPIAASTLAAPTKKRSRCGAAASADQPGECVRFVSMPPCCQATARRALTQVTPKGSRVARVDSFNGKGRGRFSGPAPGLTTRGQRATSVATVIAGAFFGAIQSRATNQAMDTAPTLKIVSPGTRIHTSISMTGCCMKSAERANQ